MRGHRVVVVDVVATHLDSVVRPSFSLFLALSLLESSLLGSFPNTPASSLLSLLLTSSLSSSWSSSEYAQLQLSARAVWRPNPR